MLRRLQHLSVLNPQFVLDRFVNSELEDLAYELAKKVSAQLSDLIEESARTNSYPKYGAFKVAIPEVYRENDLLLDLVCFVFKNKGWSVAIDYFGDEPKSCFEFYIS